jgi:2-oxoisovalerate dehydrogenase E1 component beta subunit
MPVYNIIQAVNDALRLEMRRNQRVVVLGEDVGRFGGVFRATSGLQEEFGEARVMDTPLAEAGIVGTAIGMALYGLRPIAEIQFADFIYPAFDQIVNELAKFRYRSGGEYPAPVVIRTPYGGGIRGGHYHSQSPEAYFAHTPGLKVVIPSNPYDAKGLLLTAMREEDPVLFMEPKRVYRAARGEVPEGDYTIPFGQAKIVRAGSGVTVLCYGSMVHTVQEALDKQGAAEFDPEVLDLRSIVPLDTEAILAPAASSSFTKHPRPVASAASSPPSSLRKHSCTWRHPSPASAVWTRRSPIRWSWSTCLLLSASPRRSLIPRGFDHVP